MSWLFGIRKDGGVPPEAFNIPVPPDSDGGGDDKNRKNKGSTAFANFDSRPFEVAAKAVKELEQSSKLIRNYFRYCLSKYLNFETFFRH